MLRLHCVAQTYDWGRKGQKSEVGCLYSLGSGSTIAEEVPYAELWMGTHPSGPSVLSLTEGGSCASTTLLSDWIKERPEVLGEKVYSRWHGALPFLFKVLSVAKALSIQAHPDKKLAEKLHNERPDVYKDDNHKPEMALALTEFETLCAFVSIEELQGTLASVPELRALVGDEASAGLASSSSAKEALRAAFTAVMVRDRETVAAAVARLVARLEAEGKDRDLSPKERLVLRLNLEYPGDVGIFSSFFLNYLVLAPGDCIYLAANEPHAYLAGECIECMATSDNVVRAGLTPKLIDTQVLCSMLTYIPGNPEVLKGTPIDANTRRYVPPFDEFEVDRIEVAHGTSYKVPAVEGPSILLVQRGDGLATQVTTAGATASFPLKRGDVFFLPARWHLELSAVIDAVNVTEGEPLQLFRAGCNDNVFG